jgi:hypothetical protein
MAVIDRDLVRAINSGRCFALIGAGPSCELGVPSWEQLSQKAVEKLNALGRADIARQCQGFLSRKSYPKVFSLAEKALGNPGLMAFINEALAGNNQSGRLYRYVASWPFACYLTTNFDDHLSRQLTAAGLAFVTLRNSRDDLRAIRATSKGLVVKIHGDTSVPQDIVLTAERYLEFQKSPTRQYWRDSLMSLLKMVDLVIIGYSASDPDLQEQLERAKQIASPDHPIFMFAAGFDPNAVKELYLRFNIRIIPYNNEDDTHRELHRLLARYDPFIAKRGTRSVGLEPVDESAAILASSIYLFTQLRVAQESDCVIEKAYEAVVAQLLSDVPEGQSVTLDDLHHSLAKKTFATTAVDPTALGKALNSLYSRGIVGTPEEGKAIALTVPGRELVARFRGERSILRDKFRTACEIFLRHEYPNLQDQSISKVINNIEIGLVRAFEKRGMEIAHSIFLQDTVDVSDATDILQMLNESSTSLSQENERVAYADLMIEVMLKPNNEMREYLSAISHGYFAFHALGLEPRCSRERLNMAKERLWLLDSSILLPLLAKECLNHQYALDLLDKMKHLAFGCRTTERLFDEVKEHAWWAITNFSKVPVDSPSFLQAAIAGIGYRQNLFLDGFVKWSARQGNPSFEQYMRGCLGSEYAQDLLGAVRSSIMALEVEIVDFRHLDGFSQDLYAERDQTAKDIENLRRIYGTFRGEAQTIAEAEVVLICERQKATFLSPSGILNRLQRAKPRMTWLPEAMYRFLSLFSDTPPTSDLLFSCMTQDFFYAGFDIVDSHTIGQYASPMIRQARMQLEQEKVAYEEALGKKRFAELKEEFERTPDEQKPFYSMQFAFYVAAMEAQKRAAAEAQAAQAVQIKQLGEKERKELGGFRAKQAEKRRAAEKRRRRAASRRKRH